VALVEPQSLRADESVGIGGKAGQFGGISEQPLLMIEIDDRQVLRDVLGDNTVMGQPVGSGVERTRGIELAIDLRIAIVLII